MLDKLAIALISPLGTALALGLVALCVALLRRHRAAWVLAAVALLWLWVWSVPVVSHTVRASLEADYPALPVASLPRAQAMVLLGGSVRPAEASGQLPDLTSASDRVWYAARLFHARKAPVLVLSGGSDPRVSATSEAEAMRMLLSDLGVPAKATLLEERSRNTRENARFTAQLLRERGATRVLLVTSALHMRRAKLLFEEQGFVVTAAATDHEARRRFGPVDWLPDAGALEGSGRALKEVVGVWVGR